MKITLTDENGKSIQLNIADEEYSKLFSAVKKTGYERVRKDEIYWFIGATTNVYRSTEKFTESDTELYDNANSYSDRTVAENNARADKLMRQLRRFAVEHREKKLDWNNADSMKYLIKYNHKSRGLTIDYAYLSKSLGVIYFDSRKTAQLAIDTFKDELLWYFTEYKDSL